MKKIFAIIMTAVFYVIFACNSIAAKYTEEATSKKVKQVSLGSSHSAAITEDGCLYLWGFDGTGQIGDKWESNTAKEEHYVPKKILENVVSVSLGWSHSAAVTSDGSLYTWGNNSSGQLGNGTTKNYDYPVKIMDNVTSVSLGTYHSAAITTDGSLYMWGENFWGQLGTGMGGGDFEDYEKYTVGIDSNVPVKIMDNVVSVSLGHEHSAAITSDGSLYMWGNNNSGALGVGRLWEKENGFRPCGGYDGFDESMCSTVPMKVMDNVKSVSLGDSRSAAITNDGNLYVWGHNSGELGDGSIVSRWEPIKIMDNVSSVSLGKSHSAAITTDGSLYTWGSGYLGILGNGSDQSCSTPIKVMDSIYSVCLGYDCTAIIKPDGSLYIWGDNEFGKLGNGTTEDSSEPIQIIIPEEIYTAGDVNNDGEITLDDAILTLKFAMNVDLGDVDFIESAADVSGDDGSITLDDAIAILKMAMNVTL